MVGIDDNGPMTLAVFNRSAEPVILLDPPVAYVDAIAGEECDQEREERVLEAPTISPDSAG